MGQDKLSVLCMAFVILLASDESVVLAFGPFIPRPFTDLGGHNTPARGHNDLKGSLHLPLRYFDPRRGRGREQSAKH